MVNVPYALRIHANVCEILARCESGEKPPLAIAQDCFKELDRDPSWTAQDVERIRQEVIRALSPPIRK